MPLNIIIRADASETIGHGHVMRCLTLADALKISRCSCAFASIDLPDVLAQRLTANEHRYLPLSDEAAFLDLLTKEKPDWVIVDHYDIDAGVEKSWRKLLPELKIMVIDDLANRPHDCDVLLDQTPSRVASDYASLVPDEAELYLGIEYALLRPEFAKARTALIETGRTSQDVMNILVTLGGGDVSAELAFIETALKSLQKSHQFTVTVLGFVPEALSFFRDGGNRVIEYTDRVFDFMVEADLCIGAAGGTSWERCCLGLPTVFLTLADNQKDNAAFLSREGVALSSKLEAGAIEAAVGQLLVDGERRKKLSEASFALCDGKGASRARAMLLANAIEIREATMDDARFVYDARYSDGAEQYYRERLVPEFEAHVRWIAGALSDHHKDLMIFLLVGQKIAHVRVDNKEYVSLYLASEHRGNRLGNVVLKALQRLASNKRLPRLVAEVHEENKASMTVFREAMFVEKPPNNHPFVSLIWENEND